MSKFTKSNERKDTKYAGTKGKKNRKFEEDGDRLSREIKSRDYNDISWYAKNPQLLKDSASFPFSHPTGSAIPKALQSIMPNRLPGVMLLHYHPVPGISTDGASPINLAARAIYSFVRHANSGHANYDSPDLMMYLLAMDSIHSYHAYLVRLETIARSYNVYNKYLPAGLFEALHVNYDDVTSKLADLREYINVFATKIGALVTPVDMSFTTRHVWLNLNVFTDGPESKSQYYMFTPDNFWLYDETSAATGGKLVPKILTNWSTAKLTVADLIKFGNDLINAVIGSEDLAIMSGDILKAYQGNVSKIGMLDTNAISAPIYNMELLTQINNCVPVPVTLDDITQINNNVICKAKVHTSYDPITVSGQRIFTLPSESPTPEEVMIGSRLQITVDPTTKEVTNAGSEIIGSAAIYAMNHDGSYIAHGFAAIPFGTDPAENISSARLESMVSQFDYHPMYPIIVKDSTGNTVDTVFPIGDVKNFTYMDVADVAGLHQSALLSMFSTPQIGLL